MANRTIGGGGRQHTSLASWEAFTDNVLTEIESGEGFDEGGFTQSSVIFLGATTTASFYRRLYATAGDEYDITTDTGVHNNVLNARSLFSREAFLRVEYWRFERIGAPTGNANPVALHASSSDNRFIGVTSIMVGGTGEATGHCCFDMGGDDHEMLSCIAIGSEGVGDVGPVSGFSDDNDTTGTEYFNCVAFGIDNGTTAGTCQGFHITPATATVENCLSIGNEDNDFAFGGSTSHDFNASEDTTADGTNSVTGVSLTAGTDIEDAAALDFRPSDGGVLIDEGTDSPGTVDSSMDPDVDHVPTFEIGAYNFTAAVGTRRIVSSG